MTSQSLQHPHVLHDDPVSRNTLPSLLLDLSRNENPLGPSPEAITAMTRALASVHRYPDSTSSALRTQLGQHHGLDAARIVLDHGSEALLRLIVSTFTTPGEEVLFGQYSFPGYTRLAQACGATPVRIPMPGLLLKIENVLDALSVQTRIVILDNPNNPTGQVWSQSDLARIHRFLPRDVLLVLDAAYAEYVQSPQYSVGFDLATDYENVIVTRTFSKFYGLAGVQVGWAYGAAPLIDMLNKARLPFSCHTLAQVGAQAALGDAAHQFQTLAHYHDVMPWFCTALDQLDLPFIPSQGNFVLVDFETKIRAQSAQDALHTADIIIRAGDDFGLESHLRISLGRKEEMERVIQALARWRDQEAPFPHSCARRA